MKQKLLTLITLILILMELISFKLNIRKIKLNTCGKLFEQENGSRTGKKILPNSGPLLIMRVLENLLLIPKFFNQITGLIA